MYVEGSDQAPHIKNTIHRNTLIVQIPLIDLSVTFSYQKVNQIVAAIMDRCSAKRGNLRHLVVAIIITPTLGVISDGILT